MTITINTLEKAKKITKSLFDYSKEKKTTLSSFRSLFSRECGFNELQDAFQKENERKREFVLSQYISYLDDPRVTIEVAREIGEDYEKAETYFAEHFQNHDGIMFPVLSVNMFYARCQEILTLFGELEWFNTTSAFKALTKMSFEKSRIRYVSDDIGNYGNPELIVAIETMELFFRNGADAFEQFVQYNHEEDWTPEDGFYNLYKKVKLLTRGFIFSQCNVGQGMNDSVQSKNKEIRENIRNKKLKAKELKEKNLKVFYRGTWFSGF